jgi:hypothetical protein
MNALNDFVPAGYPLPWNPITLADFVPGGFPLPQNPIYFASSNGSLPKAPSLPMAAIGAKNGKAAIAAAASDSCGGCGCGGSCGGCGGLGAIAGCATCSASMTSDTIIPQASLPAFLQGDAYMAGFPTVYIAGAVVLLVGFMMMGGKRGRR